jgi:flagellar hook-basal body complex protein FliE
MVMPIKPSALPMPELASAKLGTGSVGKSGASANGTSALGAESTSTTDFSATLRNVLSEANDTQKQAATVADDYANGKQNDLHGTMITMTEADINLRLVANVRNKVIDAYREVMRMGS